MADKPILFSGPMVRAILEGRKTQTRRVVKRQPPKGAHSPYTWGAGPKPGYIVFQDMSGDPLTLWPYAPGDRLWVREHWRTVTSLDSYSPAQMADLAFVAGYERPWAPIRYEADGVTDNLESCDPLGRHRQGMHMPRWASRLTLSVTDVRVQRLQDISEDDARAEGIERLKTGRGYYEPTVSKAMVRAGVWHRKATHAFEALWDSLNAKRGFGWDANPWVCAVSFEVQKINIDQLEAA